MEINQTSELIALSKALNFIKFRCTDSECTEFATSPLIVDILRRVNLSLEDYYKKKIPNYSVNSHKIEDAIHYIDVIKNHVRNIPNWNSLHSDIKHEVVKNMIGPFGFDDQTLVDIVTHGDQYHGR